MSVWAEAFLGVIALATLTTALAQIGVLAAASRLSRRVESLADSIENDLRPVLAQLQALGRDASRAAAMATAQVEHIDRFLTNLTERTDQILSGVHSVIVRPAREGVALLRGLRAALYVIRSVRTNGRRRSRVDDEDALFV